MVISSHTIPNLIKEQSMNTLCDSVQGNEKAVTKIEPKTGRSSDKR